MCIESIFNTRRSIPKASFRLDSILKKPARWSVAEEAARLMIEGGESEYLNAKERAIAMLGLSDQSRLPSNRQIRDCIGTLTKSHLGADEINRRVREMREIAEQIMTVIDDCDPFLIGSTLSGQIRECSDIDLHAYCDEISVLTTMLNTCGYEEVEVETIENRKGTFTHLRWHERDYPVEITVYEWSWRDLVLNSSVTGKPMKRVNLETLRRMLKGKKI